MADYDIRSAFERIEDELISSMVQNMSRHRAEETAEGYEWSMWQAEQLRYLEQYKKANSKKYGKEFGRINRNIETVIREAYVAGGMEQEIEILEAIKNGFRGHQKSPEAIQGAFFRANERKLEALVKATTSDMQRAETAILRMANDQYRKAIYNAQVYANTGAGTYEKAVDMATHDMLAAGLNCVEYKNGTRHTLKDYADMSLRTASKRAYLSGEGTKRQEWGISTVIMNKRGNPCPKCLPFVGKVLIDDVWSGGKSSDGPYPLMSSAIAAGLYHPRCKDSHTTYFSGISTADDKWTKQELDAVDQANKQEAKEQYAERQAEKFGRLAEYSLAGENRAKYQRKANDWKTVAKAPESDIIKLPRYEEAVIPRPKFTEYALNPEKAPDKAAAFKVALGYTIENVDNLIDQIYKNLPNFTAVPKGDKGWGMTYEVIMELQGPNGKKAKVLTAWIDDKNNGEMRLTTAHVD